MEIVAAIVFVGALVFIVTDWIHRAKAALAGAGIIVVVGSIDGFYDQEHAIDAIDWGTLGLLVGMMLIVGITEQTGIFTYLALKVVQLSRGSPFLLIFLLGAVTGVLSAFLDNLTAILLVVPITLLIADLLRIPAVPLVLIEVMASNIGGAATLIGDPPNILIGSRVPELSFMDFIINLAPVAIFTLVTVSLMLYFLYRREFVVSSERMESIQRLDPARDMKESPYVGRSVLILIGTVLVFFAHSAIGIEPATVALGGATILLLVAVDDIEVAFGRVQWTTLFFFIGLFIMVGALEESGAISRVADGIAEITDSRTGQGMIILWASAAGSAVVDNIPFTAAMIPVVEELQAGQEFDDAPWWALALGASFGGNATLIAAAANVAAAGVMDRAGQPITFSRFLAVGVPTTLVSLVIATVYLLIFQF